jgi:hypothetical protein
VGLLAVGLLHGAVCIGVPRWNGGLKAEGTSAIDHVVDEHVAGYLGALGVLRLTFVATYLFGVFLCFALVHSPATRYRKHTSSWLSVRVPISCSNSRGALVTSTPNHVSTQLTSCI